MKWLHQLKTLQDIQASTGITPKALQTRVSLQPEGFQYYEYFWVLNRARVYNEVGACPISITEVTALMTLIGEERQAERVKILRLVQEMDLECLAHDRDQRKEATR